MEQFSLKTNWRGTERVLYKQGYKKNTQGSKKKGKRRDDQNLCPSEGTWRKRVTAEAKTLGCPGPGVQQREDTPFCWLEDRWD